MNPIKRRVAKLNKRSLLKEEETDGSSALLESFFGEEVVVVHPTIQTFDDGGGGIGVIPYFSEGILMEIEKDFIGLGNGAEVNNVIQRSQIINLGMKKQPTETSKLMGMPTQGGSC